MKISYACRVDIGPRAANDDRLLAGNAIIEQGSADGESELPALAVVCDGCGGYSGGGFAARTVLASLAEEDPETLCTEGGLLAALETAEERLRRLKHDYPQYSEMCTTIAGCVFFETATLVFHAGDSRVYRYDGRYLARMTSDHSAVQAMVDQGLLSEAEALVHPGRNVINRCIGKAGLPPEIYLSHTPILPGETYLICSDGLWDSLEDRQMKTILSKGLPPAETAALLVDTAVEQGSDDNISVCLCTGQGRRTERGESTLILD